MKTLDPGWYAFPGLNKRTADQLAKYYRSERYKVKMREEPDGTWTVLRRKK